jgi:hypothetical protein
MAESVGIGGAVMTENIILQIITVIGLVAVAIVQGIASRNAKIKQNVLIDDQRITRNEVEKLLRSSELINRYRTKIDIAQEEMNERLLDLTLATAKATRDGHSNGEVTAAIVEFERRRAKTRDTVSRAYADMEREFASEHLFNLIGK